MDDQNNLPTKEAEQSTQNADLVTSTSTHAAKAGVNHEEVTYNPKKPEPVIVNGVKVYPTSYIPAKAVLNPPKKMLAEMQEWHIEGIHIVIFFLLTFCLFIGMWKRPNLR